MQDYSSGKPTLPNVGGTIGVSTFGGSSIYASWVLVAVAPVKPRVLIEAGNNSGAPALILTDDGSAQAGNPPFGPSASVIPFAATTAGAQGATWTSGIQGRVQIYAPSASAQILLRDE